jgi:agmatinase
MGPSTLLSLSCFFGALTDARDITFPPVSGYSSQQIIPQGFNDPGVTDSPFAGLTTFANLPYVHCLAPEKENVEPFDIAILGAPFDTVRTPYAHKAPIPGSRRVPTAETNNW